jgi:hypothetical protein
MQNIMREACGRLGQARLRALAVGDQAGVDALEHLLLRLARVRTRWAELVERDVGIARWQAALSKEQAALADEQAALIDQQAALTDQLVALADELAVLFEDGEDGIPPVLEGDGPWPT